MPYSIPAPAPLPLPIHSHGRPRHRRSYSDTRGPGAFAPLGLLPRRRVPLGATFHFRNDDPDHDDHDSSLSDDDDSDDPHIPALRLKSPAPATAPFRALSINTTPAPVPFPRSRPDPDPQPAPAPPIPRPGVTRTTSTPIFLSNGKPLKSSLKSSSSSPSISSPTHTHHHHHHLPLPQPPSHLRARSAPTTPTGDAHAPDHSPAPPSPTPSHKNVHFPSKEQGGLETVRVFSRSARPASLSLSLPLAEDTETDTETDRDRDSTIWATGPGRSTTPFPRVRSSLAPPQKVYTIDTPRTSPVPAPALDSTANVYLETLVLHSSSSPSSSSSSPPTLALTGTLLVRNLAYEKTVAVRFTLDDWHTTSEVAAHYRASLAALPPHIHRAGSGLRSTADELDEGDAAGPTPQWDRFAFTIRLEDYHPSLATRTLWLVARYVAGAVGGVPAPAPRVPLEAVGAGAGEWWDNNGGGNYRVLFCERAEGGVQEEEKGGKEGAAQREREGEMMRRRRVAVSAPSLPTTTPAHATAMTPSQGLLVRSPSHASQLAETTLQRLRKLNLKNYAAPASPGSEIAPSVLASSLQSFTPPSTHTPVLTPTPTPASTSASASASSDDEQEEEEEEEDGPSTPAPAPGPRFGFGAFGFGEIVGGFPATYPALPGFEYEYDAGVGRVKGFEVGVAAFEASTSPPGMAAFGASTEPLGVGAGVDTKGVALYWPWGTSNAASESSSPESSGSSPESTKRGRERESEGEGGGQDGGEKKKEEEEKEATPVISAVPSVKVFAPSSPPARTSSPTPAPPRVHAFQPLRHAHAHIPRTSSPLASPRVSPAPSPRVSPAPSPRTSPAPSPTHSPAPSRSSSLESVPEAETGAEGQGQGQGQGSNGSNGGVRSRKAHRVFPPEEPVVRRKLPLSAGAGAGVPARPPLGGRTYTLAAAPAPALAGGRSSADTSGVGEGRVGNGGEVGEKEKEVGEKAPDADSVYQAFVRQWCFAGAAPAPSPSVPSGIGHARAHSHTGVVGRERM